MMNKSDTIGALAAALAKAQGAMTFASKDATNPHFRSKYADLAAIIEAIREPLSSNGLSYSQLCDFNDAGGLIVETVLMHESGEWISGRLAMPVPKMDPQGLGSALTYAKRYSLASTVGIAADEDDDGEGAMGRGNGTDTKKDSRREGGKSGAQGENSAPVDPKDAEYHERIRTALKTLYGTDKKSALDMVEELTAWEKDGKPIKGTRDYASKTGKSAQILCHKLEAMAKKKEPQMCAECRQVGTHSDSCPNATPPQ